MVKLLLFIFVIVVFGVCIMYNRLILSKVLASQGRMEKILLRLVGKRLHRVNLQMERTGNVRKKSIFIRVHNYFKEIIVNLDMAKDNVTPVGLVTFIGAISLSVSLAYVFWTGEVMLVVPAFGAVFYFFVVLFRFMSLLRFEKKEAMIMDTEDLISMDINEGVYNAIIRYHKSFHPDIKPYFEEFIDNVQFKGYGFKRSMMMLNDSLGVSFSSFTQKAVMFEQKADKDMADIFSSVVESNRHRRDLRTKNNKRFNELRLQFLMSIALIGAYVLFSIYTDPFMSEFLTNNFVGKMLLIIDLIAVTAVLGYIASIKAKFIG